LRGRTERMHRFDQLEDVLSTLDRMAQRDPVLVMALPRQPGSREIRYAHLLSGQPDVSQIPAAADFPAPAHTSLDNDRLTQLEAEVAKLREELAELRAQVAALLIARS
jgi:uncharacterized protein